MIFAELGTAESVLGGFGAVLIAALGVLQATRTAKIRAATDDRINLATREAAVASTKADSVQRFIDQLQEQLTAEAGDRARINAELTECHKREAALMVSLAETKAAGIVAAATAAASASALESRMERVERISELFDRGRRETEP